MSVYHGCTNYVFDITLQFKCIRFCYLIQVKYKLQKYVDAKHENVTFTLRSESTNYVINLRIHEQFGTQSEYYENVSCRYWLKMDAGLL